MKNAIEFYSTFKSDAKNTIKIEKIDELPMHIWNKIKSYDNNTKESIERVVEIRTNRAKNRSFGLSIINNCLRNIKSKSAQFSMIRILIPAFSCISIFLNYYLIANINTRTPGDSIFSTHHFLCNIRGCNEEEFNYVSEQFWKLYYYIFFRKI